jgi:hypothetical protein
VITKQYCSRSIRIAFTSMALLVTATCCFADSFGTSASVRTDNSLIVDIQLTPGGGAAKVLVTYQTEGVDPLVSRLTPVSPTGPTTITIGRLRANRTYTYTVRAIDNHGSPAGTAAGSLQTRASCTRARETS